MRSNGEVPSDLDLSFLSADEEAAIRQVLQRDEKLRKQETGRVRRLRLSVADPRQLKVMTGEWFDDLRSRRYGRQTVATDIVRSSIRRKKPPALRSNPFSDGGETQFGEEETGGQAEPADAPGCQPAFPRSRIPAPLTEEEDTTEEIALDNDGFVNRSEKRTVVKEEVAPRPVAYLSTERTAPPGIADISSVDVLEWTYPLYRADKQMPSGEKSLNPLVIQSEESPRYSRSADVETQASGQKTSLENRLVGSSQVEDSANELQSSSPQTSRTAPKNEPAEDVKTRDSPVKYLEPSRELLCASDSPEEEVMEDSKAGTSRQTELGSRNAETDQNDPEATSGQNEPSDTFWAETPERSKKSDGNPFCQVEVEQCETGNWGPDEQVFPEVSGASPEWHYLDQPSETQTAQAVGAVSQVESLPFNETHKLKGKSPALAGTDSEAAQWLEHSSDEKPEGLGAGGEPLESWNVEEDRTSAGGGTGAQTMGEHSSSAETPSPPFDSASAPGVVTAAPGTQNFPEMDSSPALEGVIGKGAEESLGGALSTGGVREQDQSKFLPDLPAGLAPISSDVGGGAVTTVRSMTQSQTGESHSTDTREEAESTYAKEQPVQKVTREGVKPLIPTIVVIPTEPSVPKDPKGCEHRAADPKASDPGGVPGPNPGSSGSTDPWEDEAVESDDDDCSSVSSVGSDLQGRRGLTSSALSLSGLSSSTFSVYSDAGDFGNLSVQGAVEFSLRYSSAGEVVITVAQCQDLAFANTRKQRTDPYVKTYLLPDKSRLSKRKTSIKKRTVNPVYGESLKYKIKKEELRERTLNLSVWHNDSRGRNVFLGQVEIDLSTWDWGHEALTWYNLLPKNSDTQESAECHGWLTVALKYVPARSAGGAGSGSGEIHVWLREARDLRRLKPQGVDSFVKCYMLPDTSRKSRQKTRVVKRSQHPVYNHAMVYDGFRPGEVREACCELSVWDHNTLSNQFLGGVRLSLGKGQSYGKNVDWMDSANQEVQLWEKMLSSPNTWVQAEVPLRSSMTPRK